MEWIVAAFDVEPILLYGFEVDPTCKEGDVRSAPGELGAEVAADPAGTL